MNNNRSIAEETRSTSSCGKVEIEILFLERCGRDIAVFAREITDLTLLGLRDLAWRGFATDGRVKVGEGAGAVAVGGDGLVVDVVD